MFGGMIEYGRYSDDLYELQVGKMLWRSPGCSLIDRTSISVILQYTIKKFCVI